MGGMGQMMRMAGGGGGSRGMGGNPWGLMRSFRRDSSVTQQKLTPGTVRRIISFAKPYRRLIGVLILLLAFDAAIGAANPLLLKAIIDRGIMHRRPDLVVVLAFIVAAIAILDALLSLIERYFSARIGEGLIYDMRSKVFSHVQRMSIAFFTRTQTGALISRLDNDVLGAQQAFTSTLSSIVTNVFTVSLTIGIMLTLSWQITLVALLLLPLFVFPAKFVGKKLQGLTRDSYNLNASMTNAMTERFNVAGALLSKLYGRPDEEDTHFSSKAAGVRDIGVTMAMYSQVFFAALMLVASLATALVYGWGGWRAAHGLLDVGTLVALAQYLTRLYGPLTSLSNVNVDIMTALVSFERVFEVLDLEPMVKETDSPIILENQVSTLEFKSVSFSYPTASEVSLASLESVAVLDTTVEKQVLNDVSFRCNEGELVALVGPSGAGKTTISQLVTRMYDPQSGSIEIAGVDIRQVSFTSLRNLIGVVTQDAHMFHDTIRSNLLFAKPGATEQELIEATREAQIWELIDSLPDKLDTLVGDRGYRLSGGEKQRLAIARLLLKAPGIVVLDEATAHLDAESEAKVQEALNRALIGRTSLVIAHRLSTVRQADKIVVIDEGTVRESGTHDELINLGGLYAELYHTQFSPAGPEDAAH